MPKKGPKKEAKKADVFTRLDQSVRRLARDMEKSKISEYVIQFKHPWKILGFNFAIGVVRGFGIAVGMTIVAAILMYVVSKMVNLPIIGRFIAQIVEMVNTYMSEGVRLIP